MPNTKGLKDNNFLKNFNNNLLIFSVIIIVILFLYALLRDNSQIISLDKAETLLHQKSIEKIIVTKEFVYLKSDSQAYKISSSQVSPEMFATYKVEIENSSNILLYFLIAILGLSFLSLLYKVWQKRELICENNYGTKDNGRNSNSYHDNTQSEISAVKSDVSFSDIGGISDVKVELEEIIDFLKNPKRYKSFGARLPRGVLLVGPPGVGKTMIAKAVANEADVPFYYQSGASFVQIYVGMGAKRVHDLFMAASKNRPAIIFIDEIDAIGKSRGSNSGSNDEREATLNQLLTEMDGFENSSGIIVIAATNKIEVLDDALLRAGRFDRRIFVELPNATDRASILQTYLKLIPNSVDINSIAKMTLGFNGASLATLCNEAALLALRNRSLKVTMNDFDLVKDKVLYGKKKLPILTKKQRHFRAVYQAAKAVVAFKMGMEFDRVLLTSDSIKPPLETATLQHELEAYISVHLSGMIASKLRFNEHDSYAKKDISIVKVLMKQMIEEFGMGNELYPSQKEEVIYLEKLQKTSNALLLTLESELLEVEKILLTDEMVSYEEIKEILS